MEDPLVRNPQAYRREGVVDAYQWQYTHAVVMSCPIELDLRAGRRARDGRGQARIRRRVHRHHARRLLPTATVPDHAAVAPEQT